MNHQRFKTWQLEPIHSKLDFHFWIAVVIIAWFNYFLATKKIPSNSCMIILELHNHDVSSATMNTKIWSLHILFIDFRLWACNLGQTQTYKHVGKYCLALVIVKTCCLVHIDSTTQRMMISVTDCSKSLTIIMCSQLIPCKMTWYRPKPE